jgi:hypothetical protein
MKTTKIMYLHIHSIRQGQAVYVVDDQPAPNAMKVVEYEAYERLTKQGLTPDNFWSVFSSYALVSVSSALLTAVYFWTR